MLDLKKIDSIYLIGEIGINHNGDLQIAKKLIDAVFACGWNCAKFQKRNPDIAVPEDQKHITRETPWGKMDYIDYKHKIEFNKKEYDYIKEYCNQKPIAWSTSIWDLDSLEFYKNYTPEFIKIPSAMLSNSELVTECCKTGFPILQSTGMSTLKEVDNVVNILEKHAKSYAILHCNSSYPAKQNELNLSIIPMYKERYNCIVGYSGHEYGLEPTVIAVALGAQIIERHITLDHSMWGTDQSSSIEIKAMFELKKRIDKVKTVIGKPIKFITQDEILVRKKLSGLT